MESIGAFRLAEEYPEFIIKAIGTSSERSQVAERLWILICVSDKSLSVAVIFDPTDIRTRIFGLKMSIQNESELQAQRLSENSKPRHRSLDRI